MQLVDVVARHGWTSLSAGLYTGHPEAYFRSTATSVMWRSGTMALHAGGSSTWDQIERAICWKLSSLSGMTVQNLLYTR